MARLARVVAPLIPHHVTQRGNRRQQVFFTDDDYRAYFDLLGEHSRLSDVQVWAWCLMPGNSGDTIPNCLLSDVAVACVMARLARVVAPLIPHHVTQRGNRRQQVFFSDDDYQAYLDLLGEHTRLADVQVWAWCLMPNHVHLMLVPSSVAALRTALGEAHRRYSRLINFREGWRGFLWQGRFASCPLDERHALAAARYIELNPVRARLAPDAGSWPWSSAQAHLTGEGDGLTEIAALGIAASDWAGFLAGGLAPEMLETIRRGERTGRPVGDDGFVARLEQTTGRALARQKPGPKPRTGG